MTRLSTIRSFMLGLAVLLLAGSAQARTEILQWTHPTGSEVASFQIYIGSSPGQSDILTQNVGMPAPDISGVYSFTVDLTTEEAVFVRMTAVGTASNESPHSNEIQRSAPIGVPGQPQVVLP